MRRRQIQDCFYKFADLTDEELQISALTTGVSEQSAIAYVRLVPLDCVRSSNWKRRQNKTNRRLACMNDTLTFMHFRRPTTSEEIWEEIYPYKDTDYNAIYWTAVSGDNCLYPTQVGPSLGPTATTFPSRRPLSGRKQSYPDLSRSTQSRPRWSSHEGWGWSFTSVCG